MRLRLCILFVLCCSAIAAAQTPAAPAESAGSLKHQLVGAWRLISVETVRPSGEIIYPFYGPHPQGLLMYDSSGWMSVQIVSDPKPTAPTTSSREEFNKAPQSEKAAAIDGYYAYFGTWTVDESGHSVTHHIRNSLLPGERDQNGVRAVSLEGQRLTLIARTHEMGEDHQRRLIWERVTSPQ
jgi:hypothetical protein